MIRYYDHTNSMRPVSRYFQKIIYYNFYKNQNSLIIVFLNALEKNQEQRP